MSDLAYSIRSFAKDIREELNHRVLCDDEREELLLAERIIAQALHIDEDQKRPERIEDAARKVA